MLVPSEARDPVVFGLIFHYRIIELSNYRIIKVQHQEGVNELDELTLEIDMGTPGFGSGTFLQSFIQHLNALTGNGCCKRLMIFVIFK